MRTLARQRLSGSACSPGRRQLERPSTTTTTKPRALLHDRPQLPRIPDEQCWNSRVPLFADTATLQLSSYNYYAGSSFPAPKAYWDPYVALRPYSDSAGPKASGHGSP